MLKKLLLADDSLTIQKVVGIVFANLDYQLLIADNGDDALSLARREFPDLVIADIGMPGKDGLELCREIKNDPNLGSIPVLLLPGAFENFDESKAVAAGADGWITKPFESQALINKVEQILAAVPDNVPTAAAPIFEAAPEPVATEEAIGFEDSASDTLEEPVGFEVPESLAIEETDIFESSESPAVDETIGFEPPALGESAVADDDIWDAVTFEEEDLQPEISTSGIVERISEDLVPFEEPAPVIEEPVSFTEEPAPVIEEPVSFIEEQTPVKDEVSLAFEEGSEDEILELGEEDILELDETDILEEVAEETLDFETDEEVLEEDTAVELVDFSAPGSPVEPAPLVTSEPAFEFVEEVAELEDVASDFIYTPIEEPPVEEGIEAVVETAARVDIAAVEEQLSNLSDTELADVVSRVAGPIIEKLAAQMLEQVIWEVVPDLAESMIKDEIRKIKQGAA